MDQLPFRNLSSPLTDEMLAPLPESCQWVQFSSLPTPGDLDRIAGLLERHPQAGLRAYGGYDGSIRDLSFLSHFPRSRRFQIDVYELQNLDGLEHLPDDVDVLGIGETRRRIGLDQLARFRQLRSLYVAKHARGLEVVSQLTGLEALTLRSITLDGLDILLPLERLTTLDLKLGGTRDLTQLPKVGRLRYVELWMIRGLHDLDAVADLEHLEFLFLQSLPKVDRLPSLRRCINLRRVHLETMKGLTDLRPVADAPDLEELLIVDMPHLNPDDLSCFVGHPTLRGASVGLGSLQRNRAAREALGLPDPPPRTRPAFGLYVR